MSTEGSKSSITVGTSFVYEYRLAPTLTLMDTICFYWCRQEHTGRYCWPWLDLSTACIREPHNIFCCCCMVHPLHEGLHNPLVIRRHLHAVPIEHFTALPSMILHHLSGRSASSGLHESFVARDFTTFPSNTLLGEAEKPHLFSVKMRLVWIGSIECLLFASYVGTIWPFAHMRIESNTGTVEMIQRVSLVFQRPTAGWGTSWIWGEQPQEFWELSDRAPRFLKPSNLFRVSIRGLQECLTQ